jgi:transposase InsO family protein
VFFLEDKGDTFGFVRDLVLRLRNERHGDAIRAICSDNGSEFRNSHFETFCHDLGLEHQFSSPYTPPQNGVIERKNRTLCEMARTMLDWRTDLGDQRGGSEWEPIKILPFG